MKILLIMGFFLLVIFLLKKFIWYERSGDAGQLFRKKGLLSPSERSFYAVLNSAVNDDCVIFTKVRVADVVTPLKGLSRRDWLSALARISQKHFDFIICEKGTLSLLCAIELNDSSHQKQKRRERDEFLLDVCSSAEIPLICVTAQSEYNLSEIKELLQPYLPVSRLEIRSQ